MIKILQKESPQLRKKASAVPLGDIKGEKIKALLANMKKALSEQEDGVAIAAPQLGENLCIFVMSGKVYEMIGQKKSSPKKEAEVEKEYQDVVFINPKIKKLSKEKELMEEGCLSVRWLYGKVLRSKKATIEAYDEDGKKFTMGASGLIAQIFQHETDHLEGVLFIDEAIDLREIPPEKSAKQ